MLSLCVSAVRMAREEVCESWRARMSSSREVVESKQPQLFAGLHPTTTLLGPPSPPYFHLKGGGRCNVQSRSPSSWWIARMAALVQIVQLLGSILELGTSTEQPHRSSHKPDRDRLFNDALRNLIQASSGPRSDQINVST